MAADEVLLIAEHAGCHFEIQEGRGEGFYVWRFVGDHDWTGEEAARLLTEASGGARS